MDARLFLFSCLLLGSTAIAQGEPDTKPVKPPAAGTEQTGDPDKAQKTPGDVLGELQREKERLQREIEFARNRAKTAKAELAAKLGHRGQELRSVKFELPKVTPTARPAVKQARVMDDAERETHGHDVLMLVNGQPIRRASYDELMDYLRKNDPNGDPNMHSQRVTFELMRVTAIAAAFPENPAEGRMADALAEIQQGKKVSEVAAQIGTVPGAQPDGTIEVRRNSHLGTKFELVAFGLEDGQYSRPFLSAQGYVIVQALERRQDDTGNPVVKVAAVQIPYEASPDELQSAQMAIATGQLDILVRDTTVLELLPQIYRPRMAAPVVDANQLQQLTKALENLDTEIAALKAAGADDDKAKARLESLLQQRGNLEQTINAIRDNQQETDAEAGAKGDAGGKPDKVVPAAPVQPPVKK